MVDGKVISDPVSLLSAWTGYFQGQNPVRSQIFIIWVSRWIPWWQNLSWWHVGRYSFLQNIRDIAHLQATGSFSHIIQHHFPQGYPTNSLLIGDSCRWAISWLDSMETDLQSVVYRILSCFVYGFTVSPLGYSMNFELEHEVWKRSMKTELLPWKWPFQNWEHHLYGARNVRVEDHRTGRPTSPLSAKVM